MMMSHLEKMKKSTLHEHITRAESFLSSQ
jgi:hypothetical protein